jgi:hypothetical protein
VPRLPASDRDLLVASVLDRLALTPWADVPLRAARRHWLWSVTSC